MPGVRATATRRASGGCGAGLGFAAREAGAQGKKGARVGGYAGLSRSGAARGLAGDASERGHGGRERGKGRRGGYGLCRGVGERRRGARGGRGRG
jgi:hypothetical protein